MQITQNPPKTLREKKNPDKHCGFAIHGATGQRTRGGGGLAAAENIARMEDFVAECAVVAAMEPAATVALLVAQFPDAFGAEATFAITAVAADLEQPVIEGGQSFTATQQGLFRASAILAADIYAVEKRLGMRCTCADIILYWRRTGETFFHAPDAVSNLKK